MQSSLRTKILSALPLILFVVASLLLAQDPSPSPSPSPSALPSPSPSASPSPTRTPSPTPLPGAQNFHQWGSVTVFNGLPSDSVRAIAQTPDGVMWFGTDNGLARFDGRRVQNFLPGDVESNGIRALVTDVNGYLWIGTENGAFLYSDNRFQAIEGTAGVGITAINANPEVYLASDAGMVFRVEIAALPAPVARQFFPEPIRGADGTPVAITSLVKVKEKLIAGTSGRGLFVLTDGSAAVLNMPTVPAGVSALERGYGDKMWIGTEAARGVGGLYSSDGVKAQRIVVPTAKVAALEENLSGVWIGSERFGLFHIEGSKPAKSYTFANTSGGLRSDNIFTLFTDRERVLWIGTNRGVSRFDQSGAVQQTVSDIPNSNFIRSLWWNGRVMYAGSNRGLFESGFDGTWSKVPGLQERAIYDIGAGSQGIVVGTAAGAYDIRGRSITGGDTRSIEYFREATYAAIVGRGVVNISSLRQEVVFPDETASALLSHPDRLYIGTGGRGLYSFDGKTTKLEVGPEILKAGAILKVRSESGGVIWIAGQHGVFRLKDGQAERIIEVEDVRDVYVSGPNVWAATTTRGLMHARHDERFGWLTTSIAFEQGLPSEKAFAIVPDEEGMLIATNRGVVTYRPGNVAPKLIPIRLLSQRVHDLSEIKSGINLEFPQNSLLIEVAGQSSRTFPEEFQYVFCMRNSQGDLLDRRIANDPQFTPSNLSPGLYSIEVVAFNRDLLSSEPLTISFSVGKAPFPWTATALGVLLLLALVGLAWAIYEHRRIVIRNRELAAARLDLANEAERERRRIARDLHDQTLADLRNLMITSDRLEGDNREFRNEIEAVSTEIRRICEDLS
ncbi:MAG TPA: two-component regulator propeller domain-containing protein, partial [Pyrinomonadaceae bacterium]|nr:two-component regulator propeller domain-containing protein [Pyrinomonadaceae bacterium]